MTDLNKCSYVLEAIALGYGLKTYASYLLNCEAKIKIFTDAKSLIYAKRNSTHSILLNGTLNYLANFVSMVNVEIYHVPGDVNVLADVMSRAIADNINFTLPREHPHFLLIGCSLGSVQLILSAIALDITSASTLTSPGT